MKKIILLIFISIVIVGCQKKEETKVTKEVKNVKKDVKDNLQKGITKVDKKELSNVKKEMKNIITSYKRVSVNGVSLEVPQNWKKKSYKIWKNDDGDQLNVKEKRGILNDDYITKEGDNVKKHFFNYKLISKEKIKINKKDAYLLYGGFTNGGRTYKFHSIWIDNGNNTIRKINVLSTNYKPEKEKVFKHICNSYKEEK